MGRISSRGFELFFYEDILAEKIAYIQSQIPGMSTDDSNPIINLLKVESNNDAQMSQTMAELYNARCITTASGMALEKFVSVLNISRRKATNSYGEVIFSGSLGAIIPKGTQVATYDNSIYITTEEATIDDNLTAEAKVVSATTGLKSRTGANTIKKIISPLAGIRTVNNNTSITGGLDVETDAQLRIRWYDSLNNLGKATVLSIINKIKSIPNVTTVSLVENLSKITDSEGRPGNCFEVYVLGGEDSDILQAIYEIRGAGIRPFGQIVSKINGMYDSAFTRVVPKSVTFNVRLYPKEGVWNPIMESEIKDNIVEAFKYSEIGGMVSFSAFLDGMYDEHGRAFYKFDNFEFIVNGIKYGVGSEVKMRSGEIADITHSDINITYGVM